MKLTAIPSRVFNWIKTKTRAVFRWLFMKREEVQSEQDLFTFQTKKMLVVTASFLLFSILLAVTLVALWREGEPVVAVPDVLGQHVTDAVVAIQQRNLRTDVKIVSNPELPPAVVVDQNPKGGFFTKEQRAILLLVNQHIQEGELPSLPGKTLREAEMIISSLSNTNFAPFIQNVAYTFSESVEPGIIISQQPPPGERIDSSIPVNLLVSKGAEGMIVELPDFSTMNIDAAIRWVSINDLTPKIIRQANAAEGSIAGQSPAPGTQVSHGSVVTIEAGTQHKYGIFDFVFPRALRLSEANIQEGLTVTEDDQDDDDETAEIDPALERQQAQEQQQASLMRQGTRSYAVQLFKSEGGQRSIIHTGEYLPGEQLILPFTYSDTAVLEMYIGGQRFISRKYL